MKTIVTIQNFTERNLPFHFQGKRYELTPMGTAGATMPVTEGAAKAIIDHYGKDHVRVIDDSSTTAYKAPEVEKTTVWLANISGDPDAPAQIVVDYVREGEKKGQPIMGVNPDALPHPVTVRCYAGKGQVITTVEGGQRNAYTHRKKVFTIQPFEVKEFPITIARQFELREQAKGPGATLSVIRSRDQRELFRPTMKWELNHMRYWFMLASPDGMNPEKHGPSEAEVLAATPDEDEQPMALHEAKLTLWKRCFVLCAQQDFPLPTEKDLEKFIAKRMKQEAAQAKKESAQPSA